MISTTQVILGSDGAVLPSRGFHICPERNDLNRGHQSLRKMGVDPPGIHKGDGQEILEQADSLLGWWDVSTAELALHLFVPLILWHNLIPFAFGARPRQMQDRRYHVVNKEIHRTPPQRCFESNRLEASASSAGGARTTSTSSGSIIVSPPGFERICSPRRIANTVTPNVLLSST